MKVLWITNIKLPPLAKHLGLTAEAVGGWMISSLNQLKKLKGIEIAVATLDDRNQLYEHMIEGVRYFVLPTYGKKLQVYNPLLENEWKYLNRIFKPDIVHIHGTEFPHSLAWVRANDGKNVCVSIQGLVSVYERYYKTDSCWFDFFPLTIRDFVKFDWISRQRLTFKKRGENEKELLRSVSHIIGRTEWDKSHAWAINPTAKYHYCGEILRDEFYLHKWKYENCEPHSIFVSQGNYPIKGLHMLLKAMPLVLREYPDTKIYVSGNNILKASWRNKTGYSKFIERLIRKFKLEDKIIFLGTLDEKQMCNRYLKSNVFVLPSAIENSPNSLGEAQLLGVPFIASYSGGIPEIVNNDLQSIYRYEEYEMLARKICKIFSSKNEYKMNQMDVSKYDKLKNSSALIDIYKQIMNTNQNEEVYN